MVRRHYWTSDGHKQFYLLVDEKTGRTELYVHNNADVDASGGWTLITEPGRYWARIARELLRSKERLIAAMEACMKLVRAYENGKENGGSVNWEDLDQAHAAALRAVKES